MYKARLVLWIADRDENGKVRSIANVFKDVELPFVPTTSMRFGVDLEQEHAVESVFWAVNTERFIVELEEIPPVGMDAEAFVEQYLIPLGWVDANFPWGKPAPVTQT